MNDIYQQIQFYVAALWRKRWYAVPVAWALCIAGWMAVMGLPDRYESQARIYVDTDTLLSPLLRGISVQGNIAAQVDFMQRTLLSRPNLEKLIRMTDLDLSVNTEAEKDALLKDLASRITITGGRGRGHNLFSIEFTDENPDIAQRVVQALLSIFVESNVGQSRNDIEKAQKFLDSQIADYEKQLREAETRLAAFKREHLEFAGGSTSSYAQRVQQLRGQRTEIVTQLNDAKSRSDSLRRDLAATPQFLRVDQLPAVIINGQKTLPPKLALLQSRIEDAQKIVDALSLRFTEKHPDLIAARRTLTHLKEEFEQEQKAHAADKDANGEARKSAVPNPLYEQIKIRLVEFQSTIETMQTRLKVVDKELARLEELATSAPKIEAEYAKLNRDYGIIKKNYDELVSRRESARIADAVETKGEKIQFRIVDPPQVPSLPSGPPRFLLMSAVLIAAIGAGGLVAFVASQLDDSFITLSRLKEAVAIPVLGSVSIVLSGADRRRRRLRTIGFAASLGALLLVYGGLAISTLHVPLTLT